MPPSGSGGGREPRWARPFVAVVAVVALLLLGAAAGLLIGLPGSSEPAVPAADSVDVGFAQDMTVHHEQAVQMAAWERDHTTDPALHQLAYDIESTQTAQIGRMQGWLGLWGAGSLPVGGHMAWMTEPGHGHSGPSAGVATHARDGELGRAARHARRHRPRPRRPLPAAHAAPPPGRGVDAGLRGTARVGAGGPQPRHPDAQLPGERDRVHALVAGRARWHTAPVVDPVVR